MSSRALAGTSAALREKLARHWEERALLELRVSGYFSQLLTELLTVGADPEVLHLVARAPHDEVRHAEICRATASIYRGCEVPWPSPGPTPIAAHEGVAAEFVPTLHVATMCCVNETIAGAWLEGCYAMATVTVAKRALRALLREEIDHARIGWAHLASKHVTPRMRRSLAKWLRYMIDASLTAWLRPDRVIPMRGVPAHGVPSAVVTRQLVHAAVRDLVLPGFAHVGVDVTDARTHFFGPNVA
jgi:hypothetical protein